jgi:hypothetical protein
MDKFLNRYFLYIGGDGADIIKIYEIFKNKIVKNETTTLNPTLFQ